ncbi:hypothetical protein SLEP1_g8714 [Rubroshorea leprosula]|uniref:Uncharacterized protein n=1 Tax=Rubroshorea leprosula TaxID=152421 RepID=A0AAV5I2M3_9ROSI|nr:hypothetical protein SLEP1_g8714 [Rubroshorea leprosula]
MQEKCRYLVEGVDTLQLVLHIFQLMLDLCTLCSSSALRARPLQLMADLGSDKCFQLMLDLCTSCSTSALHARPLQLVADLGSECLSSSACAQVLHFVLDLGSRCFQLMLDLCTSCSTSALHAWPLQLVFELGSSCLSSAARVGALQLLAAHGPALSTSAFCNSCFSISHLGLVQFVAWTFAIRSLCSSKTFVAARAQIRYLDLVLQQVVSAHVRDNGISRISDFDDEDGELEALADGAGGGSHVSGEPVDDSTVFVECHLPQLHAFLHQTLQPHFCFLHFHYNQLNR